MKDKITLYALGILTIIILAQNVQVYLLKRKANKIIDEQIAHFQQLKVKNLMKADSIESFKKAKLSVITQKEKSFYEHIAKAKENNLRYEQIKKNINATDDADSLARQISKRYSKR